MIVLIRKVWKRFRHFVFLSSSSSSASCLDWSFLTTWQRSRRRKELIMMIMKLRWENKSRKCFFRRPHSLILIFIFGLVVFNHMATIKEEKRRNNDDNEAEMRKRINILFFKLTGENGCCRSVLVQIRKTFIEKLMFYLRAVLNWDYSLMTRRPCCFQNNTYDENKG